MNTKLRLGAWVTSVIHAKLRKNGLTIKKIVINRKRPKGEKERGQVFFFVFFVFLSCFGLGSRFFIEIDFSSLEEREREMMELGLRE